MPHMLEFPSSRSELYSQLPGISPAQFQSLSFFGEETKGISSVFKFKKIYIAKLRLRNILFKKYLLIILLESQI